MPAEQDAKTEPATPRRRQESRQNGQVAKSQDLSAAMLLLGGLIMLRITGPSLWFRLMGVFQSALSAPDGPNREQLTPFLMATTTEVFKIVLPFLALMVLLALVALYSQVGLLWTLKPLTPSLNKINPIAGIRRMFSGRSVVMLFLNLGKLSLVTAVAYALISRITRQIVFSMTLETVSIVALCARLCFQIGVTLAVVLLLLALIDYAYQRYRHEKDLKMTKEEIKDEMRSMEGDPMVKRRRREVQLQLAAQRLKQTVPQADVVVTNPTHVSVALQYDAETMAAPRVTAKGADHMAIRIRQIAAAAGVPILERPPLARTLYSTCDIGQEIPLSS